MLDLRPTPYDHPDAVRLTAEVQAFYRERYGDEDVTPLDPAQFAFPHGFFVVGYVDGTAVACGGWRARDGGEDPEVHNGDAEIKRMYVAADHRGRGHARAVLAELERRAVDSGRTRMILETGTRQPEAIALYLGEGYAPTPKFGVYRGEPDSRCYAKSLLPSAPGQRIHRVAPTPAVDELGRRGGQVDLVEAPPYPSAADGCRDGATDG